MKFQEIKSEILKRAKSVDACQSEYDRAEKAKTTLELLKVVTDNFIYCCDKKIIDVELLEKISIETCNKANLYVNQDCKDGYLFCYGNSTAECYGNSTARCFGNSTAWCYGNSTAECYGNSTAWCFGNSTARCFDNSTARCFDNSTAWCFDNSYLVSYNSIDHKLSDKAICRYYYDNKIVLADKSMKIEYK